MGFGWTALGERMKVSWEEAHAGDRATVGFTPAEQDDRLPGYDPLGDRILLHSEKLTYWSVKQVPVRCKNIMFVMEDIL